MQSIAMLFLDEDEASPYIPFALMHLVHWMLELRIQHVDSFHHDILGKMLPFQQAHETRSMGARQPYNWSEKKWN